MKVITLFNQKGGVGKTTLSFLIGLALAKLEYRVLLIDTDGQGSLTTLCKVKNSAGFYKFVKWGEDSEDYVPTAQILKRVPPRLCDDGLYIVPGSEDSWGIVGSTSMRDITVNINRRFEKIAAAFDFVIVDTQPSSTTLHDALALLTDWFLIPTDTEPLSAASAVSKTKAAIEFMRSQSLAQGRDKARIMGVIPNKFRRGVGVHEDNLAGLSAQYGDLVFSPIPMRADIPTSQHLSTSLFDMKTRSGVIEEVQNMVDRIEQLAEDVYA